jgi:hypothetical protein
MTLRNITLGLLCGVLSATASMTVFAQDKLAPDGAEGTSYYAAFPVTITIDGDFADWAGVPYASVEDGPLPASDPAQNSLTFAVVADADNLYFSALVKDAQIVAGTHGINYFNEDSVELYINATGDRSLTSYAPGVAQIVLPAANIGLLPGQGAVSGINFEGLGIRSATIATADGYAIEAAIPLRTAAWDITPEQDGRLGLQVDLNSASQLDRDVKMVWSLADTDDQSYQNPSVFGELIFFQVPGATMPTPAPSAAGFTVDGATILDPNGQPFVAKGVNVSGMNWTWARPTVPDIDLIANCWKFNLVRVNSFLFLGQIRYPQHDTNNNLDAIVRAFTSRGIVVVLEAHDRIGGYYLGADLDTLVRWYTDLATRYRDNPYVWFDVMNEPGNRSGIDAESWVYMHGEVIEAIRGTAQANNVIIVEGAYGGQDSASDSAILQHSADVMNYNGQHYSNIVFSIHPYDLWNGGDAQMADFFDRVQAQNLALVVGEYGVQTDQNVQAAAQSIFNTAPPRNVGRIVWHWDGGDDNDLTTGTSQGGGWEIDNCEAPTNLSWLGEQVWNDNHQ